MRSSTAAKLPAESLDLRDIHFVRYHGGLNPNEVMPGARLLREKGSRQAIHAGDCGAIFRRNGSYDVCLEPKGCKQHKRKDVEEHAPLSAVRIIKSLNGAEIAPAWLAESRAAITAGQCGVIEAHGGDLRVCDDLGFPCPKHLRSQVMTLVELPEPGFVRPMPDELREACDEREQHQGGAVLATAQDLQDWLENYPPATVGGHAIPVEKIVESPFNHRSEWGDLAEFAPGIRIPGRARLLQDVTGHLVVQLIFGARRLRGCKAHGFESMPLVFEQLDDVAVLELQVIENFSRKDGSPLDEAAWLEELRTKHGRTVEQIAGKLGRSPSYVEERLRLGALPNTVKALFMAGELNLGKARLLGRIGDPKLQERAAEEIQGEDVALWKARQIVLKYMTELADAPWDKKDATLFPEAGPCTTCAFNSHAQLDLLGELDIQKGDRARCLKPSCFNEKQKRFVQLKLQKAQGKGREVLSPAAGKRLFSKPSKWDREATPALKSADYVELSAKVPGDKQERTYAEVLGKEAKAAAVVAIDTKSRPRELLSVEKLKELAKEAGVKIKPPAKAQPAAPQHQAANYKEQEAERERREEAAERALDEIFERIRTQPPDRLVTLRFIAGAVVLETPDATTETREYYGVSAKALKVKGHAYGNPAFTKALVRRLGEMGEDDLLRLIVEVQLQNADSAWGEYDEDLLAACEAYGVDLKAIEAEKPAEKPAKKARGKRKAKTDDDGEQEDVLEPE